MPRTEKRTLYSLAELKTAHPKSYAKVLTRWQKLCDDSGDCPWQEEAMASARAVIEECGGRLTDWNVGPYDAGSSFDIEVDDEDENEDTGDMVPRGADWLRERVLTPKGYAPKGKPVAFPGLCVWTGYCCDDDCIESVWKALNKGATLTDALEGLAKIVQAYMEDGCEQRRNEESMEANWGDNEFTKEGEDA